MTHLIVTDIEVDIRTEGAWIIGGRCLEERVVGHVFSRMTLLAKIPFNTFVYLLSRVRQRTTTRPSTNKHKQHAITVTTGHIVICGKNIQGLNMSDIESLYEEHWAKYINNRLG